MTADTDEFDDLIDGLAGDGYAVAAGFLPPRMVEDLIRVVETRAEAGRLAGAAVGRDRARSLDRHVRKVEASWLDGSSPAEVEFLAWAERLRIALNRRLFLGLFEFEAQLLVYPPGGFYQRHLDSLAGTRNRIVSLVAYLNRDWQAEHGGELDVWRAPDDAGEPAMTVEPRAGTLVLMLSEEIPHAVRPANAVRRVIAGWFRVNASGSQRIDPAR
ncbi:MAG: 2OG-Fe(II) oxygenase [Hyphomicrobiaceae bacterium]